MTQTIRKSLLALGAFLSLATPGLSQDSLIKQIPMSMVRIPGGTYQVGNVTGDPDLQNAPVRHVTLKEFHISKHLVTEHDWQRIRRWANANGYHDLKWGEGMGDLPLPMAGMMLKDAVLWANALSEYEGLQPVYRRKVYGSYTPGGDGSVYRSKHVWGWFSNPATDWNANGYRLPRPDEWEVAARGGLVGQRFPWGNTITHSRANYVSSAANWWDVSPTRGHHPNWVVWQPSRNRRYPDGHPRRGYWQPWCSTVDFFPANGYGLHDMAGNAGQWCVESGDWPFCLRGGSVYLDGRAARCAARHDSDSGESLWYERNPGQVPALRLVRGGGR
jgi:formylglycine-generating enzyme required for sulfatase activity